MLKFGGWPRLTWGHKLMTGSTARFLSFAVRCRNRAGSLEEFSPKTTGTTFCSRSRRPTPVVPRDCRLLPALRPTVPEGTRGQFPRSAPADEAWSRGDDAMTPKQACPRPQGLGHNLRSKTQWFTRFCNSHQVSHFTTFFIDARAEISIAESRLID